MDGIVSATFEFYCKFVIVNCTENIERTQSALYSPNLNSKYKTTIILIYFINSC
jgi:hypothetical protein